MHTINIANGPLRAKGAGRGEGLLGLLGGGPKKAMLAR